MKSYIIEYRYNDASEFQSLGIIYTLRIDAETAMRSFVANNPTVEVRIRAIDA